MRIRGKPGRRAIPVVIVMGIACLFLAKGLELWTAYESPGRKPTGYPQLVSIQELPDVGEMCLPEPMDLQQTAGLKDDNLFSAFKETSAYAAGQSAGTTTDVTRPPVRQIWDTDPIYVSIAVNTRTEEVVLQDTNEFGLRIFNRLDNTPSSDKVSEPKRLIQGPKTKLEYHQGLYIDPKNGEIYSVASDNQDNILTFSEDASGNVAPVRELDVPHRGFAMAIDEEKQEMYVTIQYPPKVVVYRKGASGKDQPIRVLEGESTRLSDIHGLAIDTKHRLMYITSWGNVSQYLVPGSGRYELPSISVYPLDAKGDTPPLRVIQGPKTQLNWPGAMSLDSEGNLYVANDIAHSILVFRGSDRGDVAPIRIIKGNKTGLGNPIGIFVDAKNQELWAVNMANSTATVYPLKANGNVAPLRTIRTAPVGKESLKWGKPSGLAYDSKREQLLVAN